jgi:O-antigen ligase
MVENISLAFIAIAIGIGGVGLLLGLQNSTLLISIVIIRSLVDVGGSSAGGDLLPNTAISALLALGLIAAAVKPSALRLSSRATQAIIIGTTSVMVWTAVMMFNFGFEIRYANEAVRAIAAAATFIIAYRIGRKDGLKHLPVWLNVVVGIPALILILGYALKLAPLLNRSGRATGTFTHANAAGAYFAIGVVACAWSFWAFNKKSSLYVALSAMTALLLTQSLGSVAGAVAGLILLLVFNSTIPATSRLVISVTALAVGALFVRYFGPTEKLAQLSTADYSDRAVENSLDWRFANWRALLSVWQDSSPLIGNGWSSTTYEIQPLGTIPHSVFVQLLVETGLAGLLIIFVLLGMYVSATRRRFASDRSVAIALSAIMATILVTSSVANWLSVSAAHYLAMLFIGALLGATTAAHREPAGTPPKPVRNSVLRP